MRLSFCFLRSAPCSVHPEVASGERHGPQDSRSRGSRPPWGLATDPQVAGPSPRPILTDAVQRAGREVLHPCESGGLRRGWQLVTCSGFPHVSASVIECAIAALVGPPLPHPGGQGPPTWQPPGSLSLDHPPSASFPRPSAGVGAAAGVRECASSSPCAVPRLTALWDARFLPCSWDPAARRERRGWTPPVRTHSCRALG